MHANRGTGGAAHYFDADVGAAPDLDAVPVLSVEHLHAVDTESAGARRAHPYNEDDRRVWRHDCAVRGPDAHARDGRRETLLDATIPLPIGCTSAPTSTTPRVGRLSRTDSIRMRRPACSLLIPTEKGDPTRTGPPTALPY
jgi:hypothetical protein